MGRFGRTFKEYHIGRLLGRGSFGDVYVAQCRRSKESVAIKMVSKQLLQDQGMLERVVREVEIHCQLQHPNIVELYEYFEDENRVYLVMELCSRGELLSLLKEKGLLDVESARSFFSQLVDGVSYLHHHSILHRDLKLSNLLLTADYTLKVADFGLAAALGGDESERRTICGTPNYMCPEIVAQQPYSLAADLWSLGVTLYTFLVGKPPFQSEAVRGTLQRVGSCDYKLPCDIPADAADLIRQLLQKDPTKRLSLSAIQQHPFLAPSKPYSSTPVLEPQRSPSPIINRPTAHTYARPAQAEQTPAEGILKFPSTLPSVANLPTRPLSTARLRPLVHKTAYGSLAILEDGRVCIEHEGGVPTRFYVSGDGVETWVEQGGKVVRKHKFPAMPEQLVSHYAHAAAFVNVVAAATPKVIYISDRAQATCMETGNLHVCFTDSGPVSLIKIDSSTGQTTITSTSATPFSLPSPHCRPSDFIKPPFNPPGGKDQWAWDALSHARKCQRRCSEAEARAGQHNPPRTFPLVARSRGLKPKANKEVFFSESSELVLGIHSQPPRLSTVDLSGVSSSSSSSFAHPAHLGYPWLASHSPNSPLSPNPSLHSLPESPQAAKCRSSSSLGRAALPRESPSGGDRWQGSASEGERWQGNPPEGDRWQGSPPEGDRWQKNPPEGDRWQGNPPEGDRWQKSSPEGDRWQGSPPEGDRWQKNPPEGDRWQGNPPEGDRWQKNPPEGDRWQGNPPEGDRWQKNPPEGDRWRSRQDLPVLKEEEGRQGPEEDRGVEFERLLPQGLQERGKKSSRLSSNRPLKEEGPHSTDGRVPGGSQAGGVCSSRLAEELPGGRLGSGAPGSTGVNRGVTGGSSSGAERIGPHVAELEREVRSEAAGPDFRDRCDKHSAPATADTNHQKPNPPHLNTPPSTEPPLLKHVCHCGGLLPSADYTSSRPSQRQLQKPAVAQPPVAQVLAPVAQVSAVAHSCSSTASTAGDLRGFPPPPRSRASTSSVGSSPNPRPLPLDSLPQKSHSVLSPPCTDHKQSLDSLASRYPKPEATPRQRGPSPSCPPRERGPSSRDRAPSPRLSNRESMTGVKESGTERTSSVRSSGASGGMRREKGVAKVALSETSGKQSAYFPGVGWAVRLSSGELLMHYLDDCQMVVSSDGTTLEFWCPGGPASGQRYQLADKSSIPPDVRAKLQHLTAFIKMLKQQLPEGNQSSSSSWEQEQRNRGSDEIPLPRTSSPCPHGFRHHSR